MFPSESTTATLSVCDSVSFSVQATNDVAKIGDTTRITFSVIFGVHLLVVSNPEKNNERKVNEATRMNTETNPVDNLVFGIVHRCPNDEKRS